MQYIASLLAFFYCQVFKKIEIYVGCLVARRGARLADEERGAAKRRGRGFGRRNH